jgi:tRNA modification GTPase
VLDIAAPAVLVLNKTDLAPIAALPGWAGLFHATLHVSALTGEGLKELEETLGAMLLGGVHVAPDQGLITRVHQRDSLRRAAEALARLLANYTASPEFLSIDLRDALDAIGEITGDTTPEDVLERIFSQFCIGK